MKLELLPEDGPKTIFGGADLGPWAQAPPKIVFWAHPQVKRTFEDRLKELSAEFF